MIDQILFTGVLMAPELLGAAAEGAKSLAVSAGTEIGKGIVKGIATEVRSQADEVAGIARTAGEDLANGLASKLAETGFDLAGNLFRKG